MIRALLLTTICLLLPTLARCEEDPTRLIVEGVVNAPRAEVWKAWTTKEGLESWMVAKADFELKIGGKMRSVYDGKNELGGPATIENTIISYDPGFMLSFRNTKAPEGFKFKDAIQGTWSVLYLEDAGPGKTKIRIVGIGYTDDPLSQEMKKYFAWGNDFTLKKLQEKFAAKAGK